MKAPFFKKRFPFALLLGIPSLSAQNVVLFDDFTDSTYTFLLLHWAGFRHQLLRYQLRRRKCFAHRRQSGFRSWMLFISTTLTATPLASLLVTVIPSCSPSSRIPIAPSLQPLHPREPSKVSPSLSTSKPPTTSSSSSISATRLEAP